MEDYLSRYGLLLANVILLFGHIVSDKEDGLEGRVGTREVLAQQYQGKLRRYRSLLRGPWSEEELMLRALTACKQREILMDIANGCTEILGKCHS